MTEISSFIAPPTPIRSAHLSAWGEACGKSKRFWRTTTQVVGSLSLRSQQPGPETSGVPLGTEGHTDAFGRDPRKEAEAWRGTARELLEAEPVQKAIHKHLEQEHIHVNVPQEPDEAKEENDQES
jgi:hypothetical protein